MPLRIVFMGTAELARASLAALLAASGLAVQAVVTQPDRPKGRDLKPQPSPVKQLALASRLPVFQPERARHPEFFDRLAALAPDVIVVAAYGQILPQQILDLPKFGGVNVHASLLPKYRGAAPIQWAILDGAEETGVSIMKMTAALDAGDVLSRRPTKIGPDETAAQLHDRLAALGAELLLETLPAYVAGAITPQPQDPAAATYARKITKEDGRLDWSQPALLLRNRIRAFTPWPGGFVELTDTPRPRLLKIWSASLQSRQGSPGTVLTADRSGLTIACGQGALRLEELQLEGGRRMRAEEFLAGHPIEPGTRF
jgi:methionyl-tRNA formyltransferase